VAAPPAEHASLPKTIGQMAGGGASIGGVLFMIYATAAIDDVALPAAMLLWQGALAALAGSVAGAALWLALRLLRRPLTALLLGALVCATAQFGAGVNVLSWLIG
jgi:hypothetical protein